MESSGAMEMIPKGRLPAAPACRQAGFLAGALGSGKGVGLTEKKKKLRDFAEEDLRKFEFAYDFGDGWRHEVELEKVSNYSYKGIQPKCIDGAWNCPPDDCGGPHGYENFLEVIRDPEHLEHENMLRWIGGTFDPEAFSLRSVNRALSKVHELEAAFDE